KQPQPIELPKTTIPHALRAQTGRNGMTSPAFTEVASGQSEPTTDMKKVAIASVIGTTVEWYDLFLFATASALVFNKIFFPGFDPLVGTLLAFGTFASAYGARILGAALFGHFGD